MRKPLCFIVIGNVEGIEKPGERNEMNGEITARLVTGMSIRLSESLQKSNLCSLPLTCTVFGGRKRPGRVILGRPVFQCSLSASFLAGQKSRRARNSCRINSRDRGSIWLSYKNLILLLKGWWEIDRNLVPKTRKTTAYPFADWLLDMELQSVDSEPGEAPYCVKSEIER